MTISFLLAKHHFVFLCTFSYTSAHSILDLHLHTKNSFLVGRACGCCQPWVCARDLPVKLSPRPPYHHSPKQQTTNLPVSTHQLYLGLISQLEPLFCAERPRTPRHKCAGLHLAARVPLAHRSLPDQSDSHQQRFFATTRTDTVCSVFTRASALINKPAHSSYSLDQPPPPYYHPTTTITHILELANTPYISSSGSDATSSSGRVH